MSAVINRQGANYFPRKKVAKPEKKNSKKKRENAQARTKNARARAGWGLTSSVNGQQISFLLKSLQKCYFLLLKMVDK